MKLFLNDKIKISAGKRVIVIFVAAAANTCYLCMTEMVYSQLARFEN